MWNNMKGWRTLGVNALIALANVAVAYKWSDVVPMQYLALINGLGIPLINAGLRMITDSPVGKAV